MGEVLAGTNAAWEFEVDAIVIRYDRGIRTPKLLQVLGERRIPYEALSAVDMTPGKRGTMALRARPRAGADPLMEAASGQLRDSSDPYRLVLPAEQTPRAKACVGQLRAVISGESAAPATSFLVAAPRPPLQFKAYDAKASFNGRAVTFQLYWSGATSTKWKAGDQTFPVAQLTGVEWRSPEVWTGHLRLLVRDGQQPSDAAHDPAAVTFGLGYGLVHESLPFAASVLEAIEAAPARPAPAQPASPFDVASRIRQLGELHQEGLLSDEEFSAKKAELLAEW